MTDKFEDALNELRSTNPIAGAWLKKAYDHGLRCQSWFAVKVGSEEDKKWKEYFAHQGWTPAAVKEAGRKSYTMPVQWPSWLPTELQ